jgi:hypothetical protein
VITYFPRIFLTIFSASYEAEGYHRIHRNYALSLMSRPSTSTEKIYAFVTVDGTATHGRREAARAIRAGREIR